MPRPACALAALCVVGVLLAHPVATEAGLANCSAASPPAWSMCWDALGMWEGQGSDVGPVYTQLHPATDCTGGCWKIVSTVFEGTNARSQLNHNIYARMMWANGTYVSSYPSGPFWTGFYGPSWDHHDKDIPNLEAKAPPDAGNYPLWATTPDWEPATCHCCGSYGAFAGSNITQSDVIYGCGLPIHHHVNWNVIWQWQDVNDASA